MTDKTKYIPRKEPEPLATIKVISGNLDKLYSLLKNSAVQNEIVNGIAYTAGIARGLCARLEAENRAEATDLRNP